MLFSKPTSSGMRRSSIMMLVMALVATGPLSMNIPLSISPEISYEPDEDSRSEVQPRTIFSSDVPVWRVSDNWMYDGYLDVADFVAGSGVTTDVETLEGTLDRTVEDVYVTDIEDNDTLVYRVVSVGEYDSDGPISIDGTNGCLFVEIVTDEIMRASDLATYSQEASVNVYFWPSFFGTCVSWLNESIGVLSVENTFVPPLENYDFPISVGESWQMGYQQDIEFSGSSNYVDIPNDTSDTNSSSWTVVSQGNSGVSYPGCYQSYNVTNYDSNGDEVGYNWFCPAIRGEIKSSFVQAFGFVAVHELIAYQPVIRSKEITIDVEYPLSPTDLEISTWINVTQGGQPVSGQSLQFRYESENYTENITTEANGSYHLNINSGSQPDNSVGQGELGSHGLVAWIGTSRIIGAKTLIIDSNIHEIDLVTKNEGVTVQRYRPLTDNIITLDSDISFSAISGDVLTFSIPVVNRGLATSPESTMAINSPDGTSVYGLVPQLYSLQESRIELNWTVPESQSFGNVYLYFEVDPDEQISEDGNRSNNHGSFFLYIGALPVAALHAQSEAMTFESIEIDGSSSYDPDEGDVSCLFQIEEVGGSTYEIEDDDCVLQTSWQDDGNYSVTLLITDSESDSDYAILQISVLNRPPQVEIGADSEEVVITEQIVFRVTNSSDQDTQNPSAPIEFKWAEDCLEGRVSQVCTLTPTDEGNYTVKLEATDDDGAKTTTEHTIVVINLAPSNSVAELYSEEVRIFPDSRGVFTVNEGEVVTFWGLAEDSPNDLDSLIQVWRPDAEDYPEWNFTSIGQRSTVYNVSYNTSGMHLATLQVFDNDGESAELLIIPIQVNNLPPEISPITTILGDLDEDEEFTIYPTVQDSMNDFGSLTYCFDMDSALDTDSDGLSSNDCDIESPVLTHSWPDSTNAPSSIVFFVFDDDGDTDSVEFEFNVINNPPDALASASESNPTEGEKIILSANGTVDSQADMDSLIFQWDTDISVDSDGDGNPTNDVDYMGRWIEISYDSGGPKTAKLTVLDDSGSRNSITMDIEVAESPRSITGMVSSNVVIIAIIALASISGASIVLRGSGKQESQTEEEEEKFDYDSAFSQMEEEDIKDNIAPTSLKSEFSSDEEINIPGIEDVMRELSESDEKQTNEVPRAPDLNEQKHNLDLDDIEALFEE